MGEPTYRVPPPVGFENSCEPNEDGWPVWKKRDAPLTPCGNPKCTTPYDEDEPRMALQCPLCEEVGCEECIMLAGRGCPCINCELGE